VKRFGSDPEGSDPGDGSLHKDGQTLTSTQIGSHMPWGARPLRRGTVDAPARSRGDEIYQNNDLSGGRPRKISQLPERWDSGFVDTSQRKLYKAMLCMGPAYMLHNVWRAVNSQPGSRSSDTSRRDMYGRILIFAIV